MNTEQNTADQRFTQEDTALPFGGGEQCWSGSRVGGSYMYNSNILFIDEKFKNDKKIKGVVNHSLLGCAT